MLALPAGWWGKRRLVTFVMAVALREARARLGRGNEDRIDWEGIADEALVVLFGSAHKIEGSPKSWLWGVIENLVSQEIRKFWPEVTASEVPNTAQAREPDDEEAVEDRERRERERQDLLLDAIMTLPATLRVVAQLYFVERFNRDEIAGRLGIPAPTLRKRFQRMRQMLQAILNKAA